MAVTTTIENPLCRIAKLPPHSITSSTYHHDRHLEAMQRNSSTPYPPPDVHPTPAPPPTEPPSARPDFLVIGLFALRLTKRLIEGLEYYPGRDADIGWLDTFLSAYHHHYALAKISGARQEDYLRLYPEIVSRMKRQPRYPMRFMQIDPARVHHRADQQGYGEMTDGECVV